jgi:hypothetical protein
MGYGMQWWSICCSPPGAALDCPSNQLLTHPFALPACLLACSAPVWAVIVAHFCFNWGYYTLLAWLPSYFEMALGELLVPGFEQCWEAQCCWLCFHLPQQLLPVPAANYRLRTSSRHPCCLALSRPDRRAEQSALLLSNPLAICLLALPQG